MVRLFVSVSNFTAAYATSLFLLGEGGGVVFLIWQPRSTVVRFVCLLVRQEDTLVVMCAQSLYYLFDITSAVVQCSI